MLKPRRSILGFWLFHCLDKPVEMVREPLEDLFARAARGEVRAVVEGVYPLERAAEAQTALAGRRTTGKLLIDPSA